MDWAGQTVVCIASGPSLTAEDCERVRSSGLPVVVTNTTFRLCPWADALFGFDLKWWKAYGEEVARDFAGRKFSASQLAPKYGAETIYGSSWFGGMGGFRNSGCCAIALAIGSGAGRVILLGYDAKRANGMTHWHGDHPKGLENASSMNDWPRLFGLTAKQARRNGVTVINASRDTALTCFPRADLESVL